VGGNQSNTVIPPGVAVFVVHASENAVNTQLQIGDVRYNDFVRPLSAAGSRLNFVAQGYPLDATPSVLNMTTANGFTGKFSAGSASQIQDWIADTTLNATGYSVSYLLPGSSGWTQSGVGGSVTDNTLFQHDRGAFVLVTADKNNWTHPQRWSPLPWVQPAP
jgi:hypothetical protein